jgi:gamma-glutamylcyclotransferase (GGCT)/AIG2-like uncharacterized protein YtfP
MKKFEIVGEVYVLASEAQDEIDALKAAQTWQPIESAPKDGTRIIIFGSERHNKVLAHGVVSQSYFSGGLWQAGGFTVFEPTHWVPLPPAPETVK